MTNEHYILKILSVLIDDPFYKQLYAPQIKILLDMLTEIREGGLGKLVQSNEKN